MKIILGFKKFESVLSEFMLTILTAQFRCIEKIRGYICLILQSLKQQNQFSSPIHNNFLDAILNKRNLQKAAYYPEFSKSPMRQTFSLFIPPEAAESRIYRAKFKKSNRTHTESAAVTQRKIYSIIQSPETVPLNVAPFIPDFALFEGKLALSDRTLSCVTFSGCS